MSDFKFINYYKNKDNFTMLSFLQEFDYLEEKYAVVYDRPKISGLGITKLKNNLRLPLDVRAEVALYEAAQNFGNLNKQEYSYISENLSLVYGDVDMVKNDIATYHLTEKKFIHNYLAIPQLDRMFDEDYFNFEWDMHVGQNFSEHRNDYNRDHFTHQIRNMYMMLILLKKFGFYEASYNILKDENCGKISEYTSKKLRQFLYNSEAPVFNLFRNIVEKTGGTITQESVNLYAEDYFLKYVIYASTILSALFHDMGYPICHFLEQRQRVSEYNPTMYMFTHNSFDSFDEIEALLQDTLLFKIVSIKELKRSMQIDEKKGKFNHGAYSAIAFLLQFYINGTIHSLSIEKQCAIEMAAVAIYNHTVKYKVSDEKNNTNYFQPVFRQNPISFLLRLCDDLQEWDRRYFEISRSPDLSVCNECFGVLVPDLTSNESRDKHTGYRCFCEGERTFRNESFSKRRLYVVNTAKSLDAKCNESVLTFNIDYDLYSLLKMSRVNNTYAKFRLKELNEIKGIVRHQDFEFQSRTALSFKHIYIDYFMTSNPITIKLKILEEFIFTFLYDGKIEESNKLDILNNIDLKQVFENGFKSIFDKRLKLAPNINIQKYMEEKQGLYGFLEEGTFSFYKELLYSALKLRTDLETASLKADANIDEKLEISKKVKEIITTQIPEKAFPIYCEIMKLLISDCLLQYRKEKRDIKTSEFIKDERYFNQYSPDKSTEKHFYNCIAMYCDHNNDFNKCNANIELENGKKYFYIGYYQDLFFFDQLNRVLMEKKYPHKAEVEED